MTLEEKLKQIKDRCDAAQADVHRALFTLEEAKEIFGVEKEKKKKIITLYQTLLKGRGGTGYFYISVYLFESEKESRRHHPSDEFVKLLTDRPIEIEVDE